MKFKNAKRIVVIALITVIFIVLGVLYAGYITDLLTRESQMHLSEVATQGATSVQRQVARDFDILSVLSDGIISRPEIPLDDKINRIKKQADKFGLFRIGIVDIYGNAITSDNHEFSVADREFFKGAMKGENFLSEPIIDKVDKITPGIVYAIPIYTDDEITSVLFSGYELAKLTERIDISFYHKSGIAFIIDSKGNVLLHPSKERIGKNIIDIAKERNSFQQVENFKNDLSIRESGVAHFKMRTEDRFFAYAPIKGANDWFLMTSLPSKSIFERPKKVILLTILLLAIISVLFALSAIYISITKSKSNAKIIKLAYYDTLTGIANAELFKIDAKELFRRYGADKYTLLNFDIKQFRYLNNNLGYKAGNEFLIHIANCLKNISTKDEIFARVGNDQFLFLILNKENEKEIESEIEKEIETKKYIENLRNKLTAWHQSFGGYYAVKIAFGVYNPQDCNDDIMTAIEKSNIARKATKGDYESDIAFYNCKMQNKIDRNIEIEKAMPSALKNGEFKLFIQPKYDLISEKIIGGEALVRWITSSGKIIMPNDFIPLFEQNGAISKMDMYMLQQLCKFIRSQLDRGIHCVPISINQSRRYMYNTTYVSDICDTLQKNGITPEIIELEITENLIYTDLDKFIEVLNVLREKGFKISLDDFGSGYSSLNVLKDLQVDTLKLDRFMLSETLNSEQEKTIVANIIRMAKELHMSVVAEGVETYEQVLFLRKCGCETAQGYYYSKPIEAKEFEKLLSDYYVTN